MFRFLPECGTARTFRLTVSLKRERHNLCSCCAHRTIYNGYNDLLHLLPGMHVLVVAGQVYPHCHFDMYPSFMSPPARSNVPYIISASRGLTRPHVTRPAMLGVIQVRQGAMQALRQVLLCIALFEE